MEITYLKNDNLSCFNGITFDGTSFFLTTSDFIYKFNQNMEITSKIPSFRQYNQLCYDDVDGCFYALCNSSPHKIFKLDTKLCEVDFILLPHYVRGLCFHQNHIFYFNSDSIFEIDKQFKSKLVKKFNFRMPITIFCSQNTFTVSTLFCEQYFIEQYDLQGNMIFQKNLPKGYTPTQFLSKNKLLISKSGIYSYILSDKAL